MQRIRTHVRRTGALLILSAAALVFTGCLSSLTGGSSNSGGGSGGVAGVNSGGVSRVRSHAGHGAHVGGAGGGFLLVHRHSPNRHGNKRSPFRIPATGNARHVRRTVVKVHPSRGSKGPGGQSKGSGGGSSPGKGIEPGGPVKASGSGSGWVL